MTGGPVIDACCYECAKKMPPVNGWPVPLVTFIVCTICGNKRCPHAANHENRCTGSNEPGQVGSRYR